MSVPPPMLNNSELCLKVLTAPHPLPTKERQADILCPCTQPLKGKWGTDPGGSSLMSGKRVMNWKPGNLGSGLTLADSKALSKSSNISTPYFQGIYKPSVGGKGLNSTLWAPKEMPLSAFIKCLCAELKASLWIMVPDCLLTDTSPWNIVPLFQTLATYLTRQTRYLPSPTRWMSLKLN